MSRPILFAALACALLASTPAFAQHFGAQLVYGDDSDVGVGARFEVDTPDLLEQSRLTTDFTWYFPDDDGAADRSFWEINLNWLHEIATGRDGELSARYYMGGGLNFRYLGAEFDNRDDESEKDLGINLVGGIQVPLGMLTGLGEARITIAGSEQYALGIGILF